MCRRLFAMASAVSLLLCAATIAAHWAEFRITWGHFSVSSRHGFYWIESDEVFDRFPLFQDRWLDLATLFGFLWMLLMLGWALARRAAEDRIRTGYCPICSYSLRGNTSGICPECGTPVAGKAEAKA